MDNSELQVAAIKEEQRKLGKETLETLSTAPELFEGEEDPLLEHLPKPYWSLILNTRDPFVSSHYVPDFNHTKSVWIFWKTGWIKVDREVYCCTYNREEAWLDAIDKKDPLTAPHV